MMATASPESALAAALPYLPRRLPIYGQFRESLRRRESLLHAYRFGQIPPQQDHDHDHDHTSRPLTNSDLAYQLNLSQIEITRRLTLPSGQSPVLSDSNDHDYWRPAPRPDDGLPEQVIARLIFKRAADEGEDDVCAVCLDDLHQPDDRTVVVGLGCRHDFHDHCIRRWLRKKNACPLCRAIVVT